MIVVSCDGPETVVTNFVHPDGSVTRKIEVRIHKNSYIDTNSQVPFDRTWAVRDSVELNDKGDTTWVRRAEKLFKNAEEINLTYKNDSGPDREASRKVVFRRKFKWFNTEYRFSEIVDKRMESGYTLNNFLNEEELLHFYSPQSLHDAIKGSQDSLKYRSLNDSVEKKIEIWSRKNLILCWINKFAEFTQEKGGTYSMIDSLKSRENELVRQMNLNDEEFDSLWNNGIILKEYIGEINYKKFKCEADSSMETAFNEILWMDFNEYTVRISMPGKVIGTNGFIDRNEVMLWPVKSDYFLTESYEMWAESKTSNRWAWVISGLFIVFVLVALVLRQKKG